jgi:hypothetical protein
LQFYLLFPNYQRTFNSFNSISMMMNQTLFFS